MEPLQVIFNDGRIEIQGFPSTRAITLSPIEGKWLADLALHQDDLRFAIQCLDGINQHSTDQFIQQALWRCAVVHFVKCFGDGARRFLQPAQVLKGQPSMATWAFDYMKALRHKHIVHDDNALSQSIPGALINPPPSPQKVAKVFTMPIHTDTLINENYGNLKLLCEVTLAWVDAEFDREADRIAAMLETLPHEDLMARAEPTWRASQIDEISVSRKQPKASSTGGTP
ncbi:MULTISPECIES: hypothetical protein [unclassified Duganella]|uniref:hypothetical protein n=1 Tax=unclassified Duganella TaxID=2636909 RepID=UPI001113FF01|nr:MULTISPECIES: hypothetical protein [unclassified Duganella]